MLVFTLGLVLTIKLVLDLVYQSKKKNYLVYVNLKDIMFLRFMKMLE